MSQQRKGPSFATAHTPVTNEG